MKAGAILRIIIWLLVAAILTALLVCILVFKETNLFSIGGFGFWSYRYDHAEKYTVGGGTVPGTITELDIHWTAGSVTVRPYDGKQVKLEETGARDEDDRLRYLVQDGKLTVQYQKSEWSFGFWRKSTAKDLIVSIPAAMAKQMTEVEISAVSAQVTVSDICMEKELEVEAVSGDLILTNVSAGACKLENVSGKTRLENARIGELEIETVSGRVYGDGEIASLECKGVSGNVGITTRTSLRRLDVETVSGSVEIRMPENDGFTVKIQKVSGEFSTDFPVKTVDKTYTYGNGSASYKMETVSGDLRILKGE